MSCTLLPDRCRIKTEQAEIILTSIKICNGIKKSSIIYNRRWPRACRAGPSWIGGGHKPNSVYAAIYLDRMSPYGSVRPTRSLERAVLNQLLTWSCTRWGLPCRSHYWERGELLPRHFTLTPCGAVSFLLHFPSPRGARALPGTLPCGVRTFLTARLAAGQRCCVVPSVFQSTDRASGWQV